MTTGATFASPVHDRSREADLVRRVAEGDGAAFTLLMTAHQERVLAVCRRMMGNREDALDAAQETFLRLYRKADRYRGDAALGTWLHRVTVNTCLDQLRKAKRRPAERLFDDSVSGPEPTRGFDVVETRLDLEAALESLSPPLRMALILTELHGLRTAEVSRVLDVPLGTVKSRLFRARRELGRLLADKEPA